MIPKFIITLWKQWKCKHEWKHHRNIYGDEINYSGGCRTIYKCDKCGKFKYDLEFNIECKCEFPSVMIQYGVRCRRCFLPIKRRSFDEVIR